MLGVPEYRADRHPGGVSLRLHGRIDVCRVPTSFEGRIGFFPVVSDPIHRNVTALYCVLQLGSALRSILEPDRGFHTYSNANSLLLINQWGLGSRRLTEEDSESS